VAPYLELLELWEEEAVGPDKLSLQVIAGDRLEVTSAVSKTTPIALSVSCD
jgi:hypothetical protein